MKTTKALSGVLAVLAALPWTIHAQGQGAASIQEKIEAAYQLTKTNYAQTEIVTAGSVLVLHKDKVLMVAATTPRNPCTNTYRSGGISQGKGCKVGTIGKLAGWSDRLGHPIPGANMAPATRNFVSGEKFWVTLIYISPGREPKAVFELFTDRIPDNDQGIRYKGILTIPLGASTPTPEEALKTVAEVITVVPSEEDAKAGDKVQPAAEGGQQEATPPSQPASLPAPAPAEPALAPIEPPPPPIEPPAPPIEPPPPPSTAPIEIWEGQTMEQVAGALGQPSRQENVGTGLTYYYRDYRDLKVTFVDGKLKDAQ